MIEPSYEASSTLRIEPTKPELFGPSVRGSDSTGFQPYLETQRNLILTDRVLDEALADKAVTGFPILKETDSTDPKVDLRKKLLVTIIPGTYLIRVSYNSTIGTRPTRSSRPWLMHSCSQHREFNLGDTDSLKKQYEGFIKTKKRTRKKKAELMKLAEKGNVEFPKPKMKAKAEDDETPQPLFDKLSIDQYRRTNDLLLQTEMDLMDLRSLLQARLAESQGNSETPRNEIDKHTARADHRGIPARPAGGLADRPDQATTDELEHAKSISRRDADPAVIAARERLANLKADYNDLWNIRSEQIRQRLLIETGASGSGESTLALRRKIEALEAKKNNLAQMLAKYEVQKQQSSTDTLKATFLREEINSLTGNIRTVEQKLEQLKFESSNQLVRVFLQDPASLPKIPSINKRNRYMAILPVAVLFAVVGLSCCWRSRPNAWATPTCCRAGSSPRCSHCRRCRRAGAPAGCPGPRSTTRSTASSSGSIT